MENETCSWSQDEDGNWTTGCGGMFIVTEGTPLENGMKFCCYCGKALGEVLWGELESRDHT